MLKRKRFISLWHLASCIALALAGALAFAQEGDAAAVEGETEAADAESGKVALTLEDAVSYAMENSRTLKTAEIDLAIKERSGKYAWNVLLPTLQVSTTLSRSPDSLHDTYQSSIWTALAMSMGADNASSNVDTYMDSEGLDDGENSHWSAVIGASVSWNLSLAYIWQIRATKADYEAGKISYEQSLIEIEVNVKKLFYALLLEQENLNLERATLENSRQRMVQAETNYRNGMIPELSLLQTQVTYENMKPEVSQLERALQQDIDTFAFLLGMKVGTDIELVGEIEPEYIDIDFEEFLSNYENNSLDLQSLDKSIENVEHNLSAINLSTYSPVLSLNYAWQPTLGGYAFTGSNWSDFPNDGYWVDNGSFSVTVSWNLTNLLPFSENRVQAKELEDTLESLKVSREMLLENQMIEIRNAINTLTQAREQIQSMDRSIELAQRSYDMTLRAYRNGTTELLDVRDAENQLNEAKLGLANEKYNYISALLDLETTLNTKLTGGPK